MDSFNNLQLLLKIKGGLLDGVAQSVKHLTLGFSSRHDLTVCGFEPHIRLCADSTEPAWDSVSLSLCPSPALSLSLSFSQNK